MAPQSFRDSYRERHRTHQTVSLFFPRACTGTRNARAASLSATGFFQRGPAPLFPTTLANTPSTSYPWSEEDEVSSELPTGYALDSPDAPRAVRLGELSRYSEDLRHEDQRTLIYKRKSSRGGGILWIVSL